MTSQHPDLGTGLHVVHVNATLDYMVSPPPLPPWSAGGDGQMLSDRVGGGWTDLGGGFIF